MIRIALIAAALGLSACTSVPLNSNIVAHEIVASAGVMDYFSDPEVSSVEASGAITCRRHKRVGTHLITKVCMTNDEWQDRARRTRAMHQDRMSVGCMPVSNPGGDPMNPNVTAALLSSTCGDSINRGGGG